MELLGMGHVIKILEDGVKRPSETFANVHYFQLSILDYLFLCTFTNNEIVSICSSLPTCWVEYNNVISLYTPLFSITSLMFLRIHLT